MDNDGGDKSNGVSPQSSSVISKSKTSVAVQKAMGVILTHSIDLFRPIQTYLQ